MQKFISAFLSAFLFGLVSMTFVACDNDDGSEDTVFNVRVSSVGHISFITSEYGTNADDFGPAAVNAVFNVPFSAKGGAMVVTGQDDLEIDAQRPVDIWQVPSDKVTEEETLIRTYITYASWQPNLFPEEDPMDLEILLTIFLCSEDINQPDLAPRSCPSEFIPGYLYELVDDTGFRYWENPGDVMVYFVLYLPKNKMKMKQVKVKGQYNIVQSRPLTP